MRRAISAVVVAALAVALATVAAGVAGAGIGAPDGPQYGPHDLVGPLGLKQRELRQEALQLQLEGKVPANAKVVELDASARPHAPNADDSSDHGDRGRGGRGGHGGKGHHGKSDRGHHRSRYVELAREGEDSIWTVLGDFSDVSNNQIEQPDRHVDNTTIWTSNFDREHYLDMLFSEQPGKSTMRNFYLEQSSGRYTVNGDVTDWVTVPGDAASYGNDDCGDIVCPNVWNFVADSVDAWYQAQLDAGKSAADIDAYLSQFDKWDRYDYDGDGNFDEPDGYIDHFQSIHAGQGEEVGGGAQGTDAIWSHRWYVQLTPIGGGGPTVDGNVVPFGGTEIGDSGYWIGDYTVEPENGGVGVFSHEFAHDLGLPDEYDTSGNTGGAENSTAWWTIMSQGSYGTDGKEDLGTKPTQMSSWDKLQLGWLDYTVVRPGDRTKQIRLGPAEYNTRDPQAAVVVLPDKHVTFQFGTPYAGSNFYYSGSGDNLDSFMTKQVTVPAGNPSLTAKVRYSIETDWDYAYVAVSTDGGTTWEGAPTNLSSDTSPNGQNFGNGITGSSGGNWVDLNADLSDWAGQTVMLGFRYWTDGAATYPGISIDDISIGGGATDGAETDGGWTFEGTFRVTTGTEEQSFFNAYVAENRQYIGFDESLKTGPYQFGWDNTKPNFVEHFPYQNGLLVWYWDTSHNDNNVGDHPGEGEILPVDSHPQQLHFSDGTLMRPRLQSFDSTFSKRHTDAITVHKQGVPTRIPARPANPLFDDLQSYWVAGDPADAPGNGRYQAEWSSVKVPQTGTQIRVKSETPNGTMHIEVRAPSGS